MSKQNRKEKKNQHYVPQGYLRKFAIEGQKSLVWSCNKAKAEFSRFPASVNKVCSKDFYYYQIEENGDVDHVSFENSLSEVERVGISVINKIIGVSAMPYANPGKEAQGQLAFFLALLLTRGPSFRDAVNHLHGVWVQRTLQQLYDNGELPEAPSPLLELIKKEGINNVIKAKIYSFGSLKPMITTANEIALTMLKKAWLLYRAPEGRYFVTTDTPVVFGAAAGFQDTDVGPAHPFAEFTIPLSKKLMLIISPSVDVQESFRIDTATVDDWYLLNSRIVAAANESVFSPERDQWIVDMTRRLGSIKQNLTVPTGAARSFEVIDHPFRSNT